MRTLSVIVTSMSSDNKCVHMFWSSSLGHLIDKTKPATGVMPSLSCALMFAPCDRSTCTVSYLCKYSAAWSGVQPFKS